MDNQEEESHNIQELDDEEEFISVDDSFARDVKGSLISLSVTKKEDNSSSINKVHTKSGSQKLVHYMVSKDFIGI